MEYIQTQGRLSAVAAELQDTPLLAVDTEAAGYHRYRDQVCLLQLSTRSATYVVDTLAVRDLSSLADPLKDAGTEVVIHDADYDLRLLDRDFGLEVRRLFDTKVAAQLLGEPGLGLANLLEKYVGVKLDKKHQRADWAVRPLPAELLDYAAEDTHYLPALRDGLEAELEARGRRAWADEEFAIRATVRWEATDNSEDYLRLKNTRDLSRRQLAVLREVYHWRETVAAERDVAPFRVVGNETLVTLAREMPRRAQALEEVRGLSSRLAERRGKEILAAIKRGRELPEDALPERRRRQRRPPPDPTFDVLVTRLKKLRDEAARELELDRGFLMPRQQLETLARERPRTTTAMASIPDLRAWQVDVLADRLIAVLRAGS